MQDGSAAANEEHALVAPPQAYTGSERLTVIATHVCQPNFRCVASRTRFKVARIESQYVAVLRMPVWIPAATADNLLLTCRQVEHFEVTVFGAKNS